MLIGSISLWIWREKSSVSGGIICASFGIVSLFGFLQFGPLLGVGLTLFAWMLCVTIFFNRTLWSVALAIIVFVFVGILEQQGLTPGWAIQPSAFDWFRMSLTTIAILCSGAWIFHITQTSLMQALENESLAEAKRIEIERDIAKVQRLESLGRLASGVAHDFNNSLAILMAGMDALRVEENDEERGRLLSNMEQAIQGGMATTRRLLSVSKQGVEPALPTNPQQSLSPLFESLKLLFPENIIIRTSLESTGHVAMPSGDLDQAVLNLCLNSRDAMPGGGEILISSKTDDDRILISVRDDGIGMDAPTAKQAMGMAFTTKSKGSGIGLALVKQTVEKFQGTLAVDSELGSGTTVTISLPSIEIAGQVPVRQAEVNKQPISRERKQVLLLEDEDMLRDMFISVLTSNGYEVQGAATIAEAMEALKSRSFDILVSDAGLPDGDPSTVIKKFRATEEKPVIICSGHVDSGELIRGLTQKEFKFLQKPFPMVNLTDLLDQA